MIIYGGSGHAKVVIDILESLKVPIDYIIDDYTELKKIMGYNVCKNSAKEYDRMLIAIGANATRKRIAESIIVKEFISAISPYSIFSRRATIGEGSVVMQGAIVQSCAEIGKHCIINTGASIDHDCKIGDFVHVSPHATLCGNVSIGEGTWIGAGTIIKQGVKIGSWSIIGAGSIVLDDIPSSVVAFGNKCKIIRYNNK